MVLSRASQPRPDAPRLVLLAPMGFDLLPESEIAETEMFRLILEHSNTETSGAANTSYGLYGNGLYSFDLYRYGLYGYGLYSCGPVTTAQ